MLRLLLLGVIPFWATATPLGDLQPFEEISSVPEGWEPVGTPAADTRINFKVALNAEDDSALETLLKELAEPSSPKYGHWLSPAEVNAKLKPSEWGKQSVRRWLKSVGAQDVKENLDEIQFTVSVKQANKMMNTKFSVYKNEKRQVEAIRTTKVHLPRDVMKYVSMIHPTTRFENMQAMKSVIYKKEDFKKENLDPTSDICRGVIIPECLRELYNIEAVKINDPDPAKIGSIGIAGFLGQHAQYSDLARFLRAETEIIGGNFTWSSINGGQNLQNNNQKSSEANLDIQYSMALTYPLKNEFISTGGRGPWVADLDQPTEDSNDNEPYYEFFDHLLKAKTRPHTVSFSYGETEHSVPPSYAKTVCNQIGKMGLLGVSIIFSSGDFGVGTHCQTNDGSKKARFQPIFPAACPWATSVGGTSLPGEEWATPNGISPRGYEEAWNNTSGGFSDIWKRPWYQEKQVSYYLNEYRDKTMDSYFSLTGRGFPDIAAQAVRFLVYDHGRPMLISGTSASSPVIAGVIALLNVERLQTGQPTLGFLNPWIYGRGDKMLNDVQFGFSEGCHGSNIKGQNVGTVVQGATWVSTQGWDPVTGMGTPDFRRMLKELPKSTANNTIPQGLVGSSASSAAKDANGTAKTNSVAAKDAKGPAKSGKAGAKTAKSI